MLRRPLRSWTTFATPTITAGLLLAVVWGPVIATCRADILYAAMGNTDSIWKIPASGVGSVFASSGLNAPRGLAFDSAGNLFVANLNNSIMKFTPAGVGSVFATTGLNLPSGLAFDSTGNLFVANVGNSTIVKFTPGGVGSLFAVGLSNPIGLAFDGTGNLYAANLGADTIQKFTPGGVGSVFSTGLDQPYAIAFDGAGDLYASIFGNNTIVKIPAGGGLGAFFSNCAANQPAFLAFTDDNGVPLPLPNQAPAPGAAALFGLGGLMAGRRRRALHA